MRQRAAAVSFVVFFYFIPNKGPGAVNRINRKTFKSAKGSSKNHEFVDVGVPGTVQTRRARAACHQSSACWAGKRRECENKEYVGAVEELRLSAEPTPTTSLSRVTRDQLDRQGIARAATATVDSCICIQTANGEKQVPWLLAKVLSVSTPAPPERGQQAATRATAQTAVKLDAAKPGEPAFRPRRGAAADAVATAAAAVHGRANPAPNAAPAPSLAPSVRFKLAAEGKQLDDGSFANGLLEIRAEMPTMDDSWDVEDVVQYRTYYRKEQWLIKWKGYGEDRNTWEPLEHLLEDWVKARAAEIKARALAPRA